MTTLKGRTVRISGTEQALTDIGLSLAYDGKLGFIQDDSMDADGCVHVRVNVNNEGGIILIHKDFLEISLPIKDNSETMKSYLREAKLRHVKQIVKPATPPKAKAKPIVKLTAEEIKARELAKHSDKIAKGLEELVEPMIVMGGIVGCIQQLLQSPEVITIVATAMYDIDTQIKALKKNESKATK